MPHTLPRMFARISRSGGGWLGVLVAVGVGIAGCKKKPEEVAPAPTEQQLDDKKKADLQAFFDGMLVPAADATQRGAMDPPWPITDNTPFASWSLQNTQRHGVATIEQLHELMRVPPEKLTRAQARALATIYDLPTLAVFWRQELTAHPNDLEAAVGLVLALDSVESTKAALDAIAKVSGEKEDDGPTPGKTSGGYLESIRCELLLKEGRVQEAMRACELAVKLDRTHGVRTKAKALSATGQHPAAIAQAERALQTWRRNFPSSWFTLGVVQQAAGDEAEARRTWSVAQQRWPKDPLLAKALISPKRTITEWEKDEGVMLHDRLTARNLASCGHLYAEAGLQERSEACYRVSEKLIVGPAAAQRIIFEGMKGKPADLVESTKAAATANPHPDLQSAVAWLLIRTEVYEPARTWAAKALEQDPEHEKALQAMWQACGGLSDFLCVIEYRSQLGMPTHFNQAQYADAKKAFDEQSRVERAGFAEVETVSVAKLAAIDRITVVPLGTPALPELADLVPMLAKPLPGLRIEVGQPQRMPGMDATKLWAVNGPELLKALPAEAGKIYVIEQDLRVDSGFAFALHDVERGIALVSLSRFRSYGGAQMQPGTVLEGGALVAAQERVRGQLFSSIDTLLGLKPSCAVDTCALRARKTVAAFDAAPLKLCPEHQKQLQDTLAKLPH